MSGRLTDDDIHKRISGRLSSNLADVLSILQENCITAETVNAGLYHSELEELQLSAEQCDAVLLGEETWQEKYRMPQHLKPDDMIVASAACPSRSMSAPDAPATLVTGAKASCSSGLCGDTGTLAAERRGSHAIPIPSSLLASLDAINLERRESRLLSVGVSVKVHSLVGDDEYNDSIGVLDSYDARRLRWNVKLMGGRIISFREQNLKMISSAAGSVAQTHSKLCMDPMSLVRKGTFGGIALFDSRLEEQVGCMDVVPLRAMWAEHCLSSDSSTPFSPPNNPTLVCTPQDEFYFVVGKDGIEKREWKLKPGAVPTFDTCSMVEGRNAKAISELLESPEAKEAGLLDVEIVALRLFSGPLYVKYNQILRTLSPKQGVHGNTYSTTIALIVSGIRKLCAVATVPESAVVFRGLSDIALPPEFFELDEQGFAGGVDVSLMSTTRLMEVARKYSGAEKGHVGTIFKLLLGKMSLGADISWLSQFAGEAEMLFPPRTYLQIVETYISDDGVAVVILKPTTFQNISTVEEVMESRKEGLKQLTSSLMWDLRNAAVRGDEYSPALAQRIDLLEPKLLVDFCSHKASWYNDNAKYKQAFQGLVHAVVAASTQIRDINSVLCKSLAEGGAWVELAARSQHSQENLSSSAATSDVIGAHVSCSSEMSALHRKYMNDPNFKGVCGKFGNAKLFAAGINAIVGPMDNQFVRAMFNEHCTSPEAQSCFSAFKAGHVIKTTPEIEWLLVVGKEGVDRDTWIFNIARSHPCVTNYLESGRNAKRLADLLGKPEAQKAGLSAAEVVALRLYTGPMYAKYNAVLRGEVKGCTNYSATIHLICSGLRKLSRTTVVPKGLIVYRGNCNMALPLHFLEPDAQCFAGGVWCAFMSTSPILSVALGYSGLASGKDLPTLFEMEVGKTSTGAFISFLSQFEEEEEYLFAPLMHLQLLGKPQLVLHEEMELSVVRLQLTVNQKTVTVEQAARLRKDFLQELANNLVWEVSHWANQHELLERLDPKIEGMRCTLQEVVEVATDPISNWININDNAGFAEVFGLVIDISEDERINLAELIWADGMQARERRDVAEAIMLFTSAIDARGTRLCENLKAGRDRTIEMRRELMAMRVLADSQYRRCNLHSYISQKLQVAKDACDLARQLPWHVHGADEERDEALSLYKEAVVTYTEVYGHDCLDVARVSENMAVIYETQGQYEKALEIYKSVLETKVRLCGLESLEVAKSYKGVGNVFFSQEKYNEALEEYKKCLHLQIKLEGCSHPDVAASYTNIGNVLRRQGKLEEALEHYQKVLKIDIAENGYVSEDVAQTCGNIAMVYSDQGRNEEALEYYRRDLEITEKLVGYDSPDVAASKYNMAEVHKSLDNLEEALKLFLECEQIYSNVYGADDEETLDAGKCAAAVSSDLASERKEKENDAAQRAAGVVVVQRFIGRPADIEHDISDNTLKFHAFSTVGAREALVTSGVAYYEFQVLEFQVLVHVNKNTDASAQMGFALKDSLQPSKKKSSNGCGDTDTSWGVDGTRCFKWVGAQSAVWACKWAIGDVIGLAANVDVGKIATSKNGNWSDEACGVVFSDDKIKVGVFPCLSSSHYSVRYAFEDFQYAAPAPEVWSSKAESV